MLEITCPLSTVSVSPPEVTVALRMRLPSRCSRVTSDFNRIWPPSASICPFIASHIIPGPQRGYKNSSMSVLIVLRLPSIWSNTVFTDRS